MTVSSVRPTAAAGRCRPSVWTRASPGASREHSPKVGEGQHGAEIPFFKGAAASAAGPALGSQGAVVERLFAQAGKGIASEGKGARHEARGRGERRQRSNALALLIGKHSSAS